MRRRKVVRHGLGGVGVGVGELHRADLRDGTRVSRGQQIKALEDVPRVVAECSYGTL